MAGKGDQWYKERHEQWGALPACNVDCIEYSTGKNPVPVPVAIIEVKYQSEKYDPKNTAILANAALAKLADIAFFVVRCKVTPTITFSLLAYNDKAEKLLWDWLTTLRPRDRFILDHDEHEGRLVLGDLTEVNFVTFQYFLRGMRASDETLRRVRELGTAASQRSA